MLDFNEYKEDFGKFFPTYTEEEQKENETNRRPVGRRDERAYLLQGALVRF